MVRVSVMALAVLAMVACSGADETAENVDTEPVESVASSSTAVPFETEPATTPPLSTVVVVAPETTVPIPPEVAVLIPEGPERDRGLEALDPDVAAAVGAMTSSSTGTCESIESVLREHPLRVADVVADDDSVDTELLRLLSELQLSVSLATGACDAGSATEAERARAEVNMLADMIEQRDAELSS